MTSPHARKLAKRIHGWAGIAAGLFWLVQALTGALIVFHWEIDDSALTLRHQPLDLARLEQRIDQINHDGSGRQVSALWTSAGLADRFDIFVDGSVRKPGETLRVAGNGEVLRSRTDGTTGLTGLLVGIHHDLLGGTTGKWIVGTSGLLLFTNLLVGLYMAWPRKGQWRAVFKIRQRGPAPLRLYSWHRALGLLAVIPGLVIVAAGVMLVFTDQTKAIVGFEDPPALAPLPPTATDIGFAAAVQRAQAAVPGSSLTAVKFPTETDATYEVRLLQPGGLRRAYGNSAVLIAAATGELRAVRKELAASPATTFFDALFPIHTGEASGVIGRILVLATGLWLLAMITAGWFLFRARRKPSSSPVRSLSE